MVRSPSLGEVSTFRLEIYQGVPYASVLNPGSCELSEDFQIEFSCGDISVAGLSLGETHLFCAVGGMPENSVEVAVIRRKVLSIIYGSLYVSEPGGRLHDIGFPAIVDESVYREILFRKEVRFPEAGSEGVPMMGDKPEFSGIEPDRLFLGFGVGLPVQPDGFRIVNLYFEVFR